MSRQHAYDLREARESILARRREEATQRDQDATRAAIALDVHALGLDEIPTAHRHRIAADVEGKVSDIGRRG